MAKRERTRATVGERIAAAHERDIILTLDANAVPYEGTSLKDDDHETLSSKLARRIDSALKRAVREGYDAGWEDGMSHGTNAQNDGWNRLAKKYGMKEVK